jgi:hypothetical protein
MVAIMLDLRERTTLHASDQGRLGASKRTLGGLPRFAAVQVKPKFLVVELIQHLIQSFLVHILPHAVHYSGLMLALCVKGCITIPLFCKVD